MQRRVLLLAAGSGLLLPSVARSQANRVLRFIPQADLSATDPHFVANYVTRNHGYMVFDTLYGLDAQYRPTPQMVEGHTVEEDGRHWRLVLREGLTWHDGERVLARDCAASIRRWGSRDSFGRLLLDATEEVAAADDRTIVFRLKRPFARLPDALAKSNPLMPAMLPERLARLPPSVALPEVIGSGPFRFIPNERVPGALAVYERFAAYHPRGSGEAVASSGPKRVHVDRVEWHTMPDPSTAASAIRSGEMDWWEYVAPDLTSSLQRARGVQVRPLDPAGSMLIMRLNHLTPPFNNPRIRRALLWAIDQREMLQAAVGDDPSMWQTNVGVFAPGTPLANDAGMEPLTGPRDLDRARREISAAGYAGERVVLIVPTDFPTFRALADVGADMMGKIGLKVDYQALDWATVSQRRTRREPVDQGGWSCFFSGGAGSDFVNPIINTQLVANPETAFYGWPDNPRAEALRLSWLDAPDLAAQQAIAVELQRLALEDVLYIPLGQYRQVTAQRASVTNVVSGFPVFWNLRKN